jgi:nucleotide-binding universal stress UspA family protein
MTSNEIPDTAATGQGVDAQGGIVVGLDGTPDVSSALRWAEAHTDLFGVIRPVLAWHYPAYVWLPQPLGPAAPPAATMQAAAESAARTCVEQLDPTQVVDPIVAESDAGPFLVEVSADAALLVVGARGLGLVRSFLLGSVGRYCADHTTVPLVIVPELGDALEPYGPGSRDIAVGIDGSEHAEDALRWAIENSRTDDVITAHIAWHYLGGLGYESYAIEAPVLENAAVDALTQTVKRVTSQSGVSADRIRQRVECGDPRSVLRSVASEADLLVVGQRGRTGLPHLLLGSTTTALTHRPVCPTAIIPSRSDPDGG